MKKAVLFLALLFSALLLSGCALFGKTDDSGLRVLVEAGETLVVPETLEGAPVVVLAAGAFADCPAKTVILPKSLRRIENGAFAGAALRELHFFDNIEVIADACFPGCEDFSTLYISAIEDPYGYAFRRESVLADKFDLLIDTMGRTA